MGFPGKEKYSTILWNRYLRTLILLLVVWRAVAADGEERRISEGQTHGGDAPGHTPLCPDGWVWGRRASEVRFSQREGEEVGVCVYLSPEAASWEQARQWCHSHGAALISLDTVLSLNNQSFHRFLLGKGADQVWTGSHTDDGGRQLWDEPGKEMVKAYTGVHHAMGVAKRRWSWDSQSFKGADHACGLYTAVKPLHRQRRDESRSAASRILPLKMASNPFKPHPGPADKQKQKHKPGHGEKRVGFQSDKPELVKNSPRLSDDPKNGVSAADNATLDQNNSDEDHDVTKRSTAGVTVPNTLATVTAMNHTQPPTVTTVTNSTLPPTSTSEPSTSAPHFKTFFQRADPSKAKAQPPRSFSDFILPAASKDPAASESTTTQPRQPTMAPLALIKQFQTKPAQPSSRTTSGLRTKLLSGATSLFPPAQIFSSTGDFPEGNSTNSNSTELNSQEDLFSSNSTELTSLENTNSSASREDPFNVTSPIDPMSGSVLPSNPFKQRFGGDAAIPLNSLTVANNAVKPSSEEVNQDAISAFGGLPQSTMPPGSINLDDLFSGLSSNTEPEKPNLQPENKLTTNTRNSPVDSPEDFPSTESSTPSSIQLPSVDVDESTFSPPNGEDGDKSASDEATTSPPRSTEMKTSSESEETTIPPVSNGARISTSATDGEIIKTSPNGSKVGSVSSSAGAEMTSSPSTSRHTEENQSAFSLSTSPQTLQTPQESNMDMKSLSVNTQVKNLLPSVTQDAPGRMQLQACHEKHRYVCTTRPMLHLEQVAWCGSGWVGHPSMDFCLKLEQSRVTQQNAGAGCQSMGGRLVQVNSTYMARLVTLLIAHQPLPQGSTEWWVEAPVRGESGAQCSVMTGLSDQTLLRACDVTRPYVCYKQSAKPASSGYSSHGASGPVQVNNMSSRSRVRSLRCPLEGIKPSDLVIWYKDGQPITSRPLHANGTPTTPVSTSAGDDPGLLELDLSVLERLGLSRELLEQPSMLQGLYRCRQWSPRPLTPHTSLPIFVRFTDVVTVQGFIRRDQVTRAEQVFFNQMGEPGPVTAAMGRDLQLFSRNILQALKRRHPYLSHILTFIASVNASSQEVEFRTYLNLTTPAMAPQDKGALVDDFLTALRTQLVVHEASIRPAWNLSLPFTQAFRLAMTEMCPEMELQDANTSLWATFPGTPVNQHALSVQKCGDRHSGFALCSGDYHTGAQWTKVQVEQSCSQEESSRSREDERDNDGDQDSRAQSRVDLALPATKLQQALLQLLKVQLEEDNALDVTDHLLSLLNASSPLTDADIEVLTDVISQVAHVPQLPSKAGMNLIQAVHFVLNSPLQSLEQAQRRTQACTRILQELEHFSVNVDLRQKDHVRYVTPNVALEVWDLRKAQRPVIGLAATVGQAEHSALDSTRIMTLSNRTWADLHLSSFLVAIELPDTLVYADGGGRLSMAIYHKPGLFLSSTQAHAPPAAPQPLLNTAIISATLHARPKVTGLKDKVKLIFRPLQSTEGGQPRCMFWDFTVGSFGGWSSAGCQYNGTQQGRHICLCDHLTNFAVLLDMYGDGQPVDGTHEAALSVLTMIGLSLSIVALALTVISFIFFKKLRQGRAQQTLFNLAVALLSCEVLILVGLQQTWHPGLCLAVAVLLHYLLLVSFLWMLLEAVLQYLTFVKVLGTYISRYALKTVLLAWGLPLIPVIAVLASDYEQYRGRKNYCWLGQDAFLYAFLLPVGVMVTFNLVTFLVIMVSLLRRPQGLRSTRTTASTAQTNAKAAFTIFILLGLTWLFGFLAVEDARLPFQYLFTVCSSLQGFLIFVLLVARRRQFREHWYNLCCLQARPKLKASPSVSNSSSFTSSRSRSSSGGSTKTLQGLVKRSDSTSTVTTILPQQMSIKAGAAAKPSNC